MLLLHCACRREPCACRAKLLLLQADLAVDEAAVLELAELQEGQVPGVPGVRQPVQQPHDCQ